MFNYLLCFRRLRKAHSEICDKIKQLMNLDLLKEINKWKDIMGEIRSKIAEQERSIGNRNNMIPWLSHWDRQLYKVNTELLFSFLQEFT